MTVSIAIPTPLRPYVENNEYIEVSDTESVGDTLKILATQYPKLKKHLYDENGELRKYINIYINDEDIRDHDGPDTRVNTHDKIAIIPAIAGGHK